MLEIFINFDPFERQAPIDAQIVIVLAVNAVIALHTTHPHAVPGQIATQSPIAHPVVSATFRTVSAAPTAPVNVVSTVFDAHQSRNQYHVVVSIVLIHHLLCDGDAAVSFIINVAVYATGIGSDSVP